MNKYRIFGNIESYRCRKIKDFKNIIFKYILFLFIFSIAMVPSLAVSIHETQGGIPENSKCIDCHTPHQTINIPSGSSKISKINYAPVSNSNPIRSFVTTNVLGNINLITSMGQDWYQQGIYGPDGYDSIGSDQSWGWTFFDENPPSNFIIPSEEVTQKNNIYALLLDDGNNSNPIEGAQVTADVTYWTFDNTSYTSHIMQVPLTEDANRKGFYSGNFSFYGGTSYRPGGSMTDGSCTGCHPGVSHGGPDTVTGYFPGNYTVSIRADANGKTATIEKSFEVTPWGCEDCHGSGNKHIDSPSAAMDSACYACHGVNIVHSDAGNPHQNTAHRKIQCTECHTNKTIGQSFNSVTFENGGLNGDIPQYDHGTTELNKGTHSNLSCIYCHNDLALPDPQGFYNAGGYVIKDKINDYDPSFANVQSFQDYYVINVTDSQPLDITLDWEWIETNPNIGFYVYPPDFNPRNGSVPYFDGSTTNKPERYTNIGHMTGKWVVEIYGFDLQPVPGSWWALKGILQLPFNYSINSTYPLQRKDLPETPECNSCHNFSGQGKAYTKHVIPDWNPGYAHVDTNGDGTLDIQCRMCHDSMHNIGIKTCQNCHSSAPANHPISGTVFTSSTPAQCLNCHGDPHRVTSAGGTDCIACHAPNDVNTSKFANHSKMNTSDGEGNVTNFDCWTCHYQKDMNRSHVYLCDSCHENSSGIVAVNDSSLLVGNLKHGSNSCKSCHAPDMYHSDGTVGPLGRVENPGWGEYPVWGLISPIDNAGCHDCHRTHNGLDEPFHGPGIDAPGSRHIATNSLNNGSDCSSSCHTSNTNPHNVKSGTNTQKPTLSNPVLLPSTIILNDPVEVTSTGSSVSTSYSLQIEAAQYQIKNSSGQIIIDWTAMNATDGSFNSSIENVNATINTTGLSEGTYNVSVRVMASGPRTNISIPYYPLNGDWSIPQESTLIIEQPKGFINGTVRNGSDVIQNVTVSTAGFSTLTDSTGFYSLRLSNGTYVLTATKGPEYYPKSIPDVHVTAPDETSLDINMDKKPTGTISGIVTNNSLD